MAYQIPTITKYASELTPHPENYNAHPKSQIAQLVESLATFGQFKNLVTWTCPQNMTTQEGIELHEGVCYILAGHGLWLAAMEAGLDQLEVKDYSGLSYEMALSLLMVDNAAPLGSEPDAVRLAQLLERTRAIVADKPGLAGMLETLRQKAGVNGNSNGNGQEPEAPTEVEAEKHHKKWGAKLGDVWQLGQHVIACLDSLDESNIKRIVGDSVITFAFADPPYGISAVGDDGTVGYSFYPKGTYGQLANKSTYAPITGDSTPETAIKSAKMLLSLYGYARHIWWGGNYYANELPRSTCWIVWDKQTGSNEFADCEIAWTNATGRTRLFEHTWNGMIKASEQGQRRIHPTQKPIALARYCFEEYGKAGDAILDPFLGNGITVLAAQELGDRRVIGFELEPVYISVILERWSKATGLTPTLVSG